MEWRLGPQGQWRKLEPRMGAKWRILAKIFANPDLPEIDDYYEPFDFDYDHLQTARKSRHRRPHGRVR